VLVRAGCTVAVNVVTQCGAAVVESRLERASDRLDEPVGPIHGESTGGRIDPRRPQRLVGVDVADSGHGTLSQQDGFEVTIAAFDKDRECLAREGRIPRLGTKMIEGRYFAVISGVDNVDTAEAPDVVKGEQPPVGEAPPGAEVGMIEVGLVVYGVNGETPGHSQVHDEFGGDLVVEFRRDGSIVRVSGDTLTMVPRAGYVIDHW